MENWNSGKARSPVNSPKKETCAMVVDKCGIVESNVSACVPFDGTANFSLSICLVHFSAE